MHRLHRQRIRIPLQRNASAGRLVLLLVAFTFTGIGVMGAQGSSSSYQEVVLDIQHQIEANDLGSARESIMSATKRYPNNGGLENLLGIVEIQSGHSEAAKQAFALAIAHSPKLSSAYLNLARIDMETADHDAKSADEAFRLYRRVVELEPLNPEAAYGEATVAMWRRQYAVSLASLAKLSTEERAKARVQAVLCADELGLGHNDAAKRVAAAMAASPDLSEGDVMLVLPALRAAHFADLLDRLFSTANEHQPLSAAALRMLGLAQEAEGKEHQAHETMERVYAMNTSATAPLIDLARLALAANDKQEALGYLAHARSLAPNDANLAYEYGFVCLEMNLLREARLAIGEAVKLAPDNPEYNLTMGTVSSGADALPYLHKYHELRPNDVVGYLALGIAYSGNNDLQNAIVWLTKAATNSKTAASAHYYLGYIMNQQSKYNEAIEQLRKSDALKPAQPEVSAELGEAYLSLKQYQVATAMLQRALDLDPDNYVANYALVRLYAQTKDPRRNEQVERFKALRDKGEEQYHDAMRIIEARPEFVSSDTQ